MLQAADARIEDFSGLMDLGGTPRSGGFINISTKTHPSIHLPSSGMEDAHTTLLNLALLDSTSPNATPPPGSKHISFFAVYDGHGGQSVAKYSGAQLHRKIIADENFSKGNYALAIKYGFLKCDQDLRSGGCVYWMLSTISTPDSAFLNLDPSYANDPSGCTAVAAVITDDWRILVGNAGDSRAVLSSNGIAVPLSYDHKPVNPGEPWIGLHWNVRECIIRTWI